MNPKQFLVIGGIVLVLVGILGFVGIIGPTPDDSIFGGSWFFDNKENWAHLILGIVALIAAFAFPTASQKPIVIIVGLLGLFFAVYNVFNDTFLGAGLENPLDLILHLVVGVWALYAGLNKRASGSMMSGQM